MAKALVIALFCVGLWGMLASRSLLRKIIGLALMNSAVVILFVLAGRFCGNSAPILSPGQEGVVVDPLPQALMLTTIVVGLSVTAVGLIVTAELYRACGCVDIQEIEERIDECAQ